MMISFIKGKKLSKPTWPERVIKRFLRLWDSTFRAHIHKWRKLVTVANLSRNGRPTKITPRAQWRLIQEFVKEHRKTSKKPQASLASIKVSVHDSTIRKRLAKTFMGEFQGKATAEKKNTKARLIFAKINILIIPKTFGQIFCGLMRQKLNFLEGVCVPLHLA